MTLDKTFCASPDCKNDCGRKMTEMEKAVLKTMPDSYRISYSYFCGGEE